MTSRARYDGLAGWYDSEVQPATLESETWSTLVRLLGEGPAGVDVSGDMVRRARAKGVHAIRADAAALPLGYRTSGRSTDAPGISTAPTSLRRRVGAAHLPLARFLQAFLDSGLRLECIGEPEERDYPFILALRWRR